MCKTKHNADLLMYLQHARWKGVGKKSMTETKTEPIKIKTKNIDQNIGLQILLTEFSLVNSVIISK
jgi:hypothetical protein